MANQVTVTDLDVKSIVYDAGPHNLMCTMQFKNDLGEPVGGVAQPSAVAWSGPTLAAAEELKTLMKADLVTAYLTEQP